jgi:hypothetical protein
MLQIQHQPTTDLQASILQIAMTRGRGLKAITASTKPTEEIDLTEDGYPRRHPPHCIWLRPLEHHREEEELQGTAVCSSSPSIPPTINKKPN